MEKKLGHHLICEATDCNAKILDNEIELTNIMLKACIDGGAGVLGHVTHKFTPQGVTVVVALSESHCSIHTYPEYNFAMMDVFTCGTTINPKDILEEIVKFLGGKPHIKEIERGIPKE